MRNTIVWLQAAQGGAEESGSNCDHRVPLRHKFSGENRQRLPLHTIHIKARLPQSQLYRQPPLALCTFFLEHLDSQPASHAIDYRNVHAARHRSARHKHETRRALAAFAHRKSAYANASTRRLESARTAACTQRRTRPTAHGKLVSIHRCSNSCADCCKHKCANRGVDDRKHRRAASTSASSRARRHLIGASQNSTFNATA